jgi:hypothetical protein
MTMLASLLLSCPLQTPQEPSPLVDPRPPHRGAVNNVSLLVIGRVVDDADPADEQFGWGLEYDGYSPADPLGWEIGVSRTSDEASTGAGNFEATVLEIYTGPRKTWGGPGELHPFVSGGLAFVEAEAELSGVGSEDDSSFGVYLRGGAYWTFGHLNVGADVRALLGTDIEFGDADSYQVGFVLGYSI